MKPSLGVIFHPKFPPETLADYARQAETAGFDELWLWEDSFYAGAFTSAATALAATSRLKVGIGLVPASVRNPLFAAMEITTLACLYPGRFMPGFGHGVGPWMEQIGVSPKSSLGTLRDTVLAVRGLLRGETVTIAGDDVRITGVKMELLPKDVPGLYIGGIREKTLRLAGEYGDGAILTGMSSPAYVRWAAEHIAAGMQAAGRAEYRRVVYVLSKVGPDGAATRDLARREIAREMVWADPYLRPLGIAAEAAEMLGQHGVEGLAQRMPEAWLDELSASGTPAQAAASVMRLAEAGAASVVLQPLDGDSACLQEYIRYLLPELKAG